MAERDAMQKKSKAAESSRSLSEWLKLSKPRKDKRSKGSSIGTPDPSPVQVPETDRHSAESEPEPADELTIAIRRVNSSIERLRKTFDVCKPEAISTPNVDELHPKDPACIHTLDNSSVELLDIVNQLTGDQKRHVEAKTLESGPQNFVSSVGNAVNVTFKYITPALKNILQVGVKASAVRTPTCPIHWTR